MDLVGRQTNMKKILILLIAIIFTISLTACGPAVTLTEYDDVEVELIELYYKPPIVIPVRAGKVTIMSTRPAIYRVTVKFSEKEYNVYGSKNYKLCKNKEKYTKLKAVLETKHYEDGTVSISIKELKE